MELKECILKKAISAQICEEWAERISKVEGVEELLQMYVDGIDFCLEKNFPSNNDLVQLGGEKLADYGIYVNSPLNLMDPKFVVLLGECEAELQYHGFSVCQLFVKHTSSVEVIATGNSFVVIDCFDTASVSVQAVDNAKVLINIYGNAKVTTNMVGAGIIKIVHKNKSTY